MSIDYILKFTPWYKNDPTTGRGKRTNFYYATSWVQRLSTFRLIYHDKCFGCKCHLPEETLLLTRTLMKKHVILWCIFTMWQVMLWFSIRFMTKVMSKVMIFVHWTLVGQTDWFQWCNDESWTNLWFRNSAFLIIIHLVLNYNGWAQQVNLACNFKNR